MKNLLPKKRYSTTFGVDPKSVATLKCPRHCCRLVAVLVLLGFLLDPVSQILIFSREPT